MDLKKIKKIAIIGATTNKEKYGYIVLRDLKKKGFDVVPVTPKYEEVEEIKTVKNIKDLPKDTDHLVFIVPPKVGLETTKEALIYGFKNLWYQPGAYSEDIDRYLKKNNIEAIHDLCIMVETNNI